MRLLRISALRGVGPAASPGVLLVPALAAALAAALPAAGARAEASADGDPLVPCRVLILDERFEDAERCLASVIEAPGADPAVVRRARALSEVVSAWQKHVERTVPSPDPAPPQASAALPAVDAPAAAAPAPLHVDQLIQDGTGEGVVQGALAGGTAAFLVSAAIASATRASEEDTLGYLVAAPAAGALLGAAGSYGAVRLLQPSVGDLRLATAAMWMGGVQGFTLQLAVFDQSPDVGAIPLRFLTVLAGGSIGLGAGAALAPLVDVEDGDVAVASSAALWGGVLSTVVLMGVNGSGVRVTTPVSVAIVAAGIGVPWVAALAAHELLVIERWPSFLIDGGGAAGLLVAGAALAAFSGSFGGSAAVASGMVTASVLAGLTVGTIAATVTSQAVRSEARVLEGDRSLDEGVE